MADRRSPLVSRLRLAQMDGGLRRKALVLLVEDDAVLAETYELSLWLHGFAVDVTLDGTAAMQRLADGRLPDAIVLDIGRHGHDRGGPLRDGLEMLSALGSTPSTDSIPVVLLSSGRRDLDDILAGGATACLATWQNTPEDLSKLLDEMLSQQRPAASGPA